METFDTILFDLDGTLTDSGEGMHKGITYALNHYGIVLSEEKIQKFIGPPLADSFQTYCGFSYEKAVEARGYFREYYFRQGWKENKPYDGITELLEQLKKNGRQLAVATSKNEEATEQILKEFQLYDYFDVVSASPIDGSRTAKECRVRDALDGFLAKGCQVKNAVLIGDTKFDVEGALKSGISCIFAEWGFGSPEDILEKDIAARAASPKELVKLLLSH